MNVIYNTCFADPWLKVAIKLKEEYGYEPVYWNGYDDDDSERLVSEYFPDAIYHPYFDAWKGIFPDEISDRFSESYIDIDFLKDYASFELQAIKMMDRMDPDLYSFNFMERQRHFRNLVKYWTAGIEYLKPDLIISATVPHRVFDYVLYLLCNYKKIKYVTFRTTQFSEYIIPLTDVFSIGNIFDKEYNQVLHSNIDIQSLKNKINSCIIDRYNHVKLDSGPVFMKGQVLGHKEQSGFLPLVKKFIKDKYFKKVTFLENGITTYHKQRKKSIEKSQYSLIKYSIVKLNANAYKKKLKKYYNSLAEEPDVNLPYVAVPLHYQPEMTSNPAGDIFADQRLCIEVLAKHLPSNYLIYVKEHSHQFFANREGHTSRIFEFYEDLRRYPQVRLIPLNFDTFTLIRNSKAVATITGTSGWEAMVWEKPVIVFGLAWYEKYPGVLKITDEDSASKITLFIENFKYYEKSLFAYLYAFSKKSIRGYYYRGYKQKINQSENECVDNLINEITQMVDNA